MPNDLYLAQSDLFRLGNLASPRLDHIRPEKDVDVVVQNGVAVVQLNNKGISLFTKEELLARKLSGHLWKLPLSTQLPQGLKLYNDKGGHYMIVPTQMMSLDLFKGLLMELARQCQYVSKI